MRRTGARNHLYKNGLRAGYTEYRYSSDAASRVTVAPIFTDARRDGLADRVAHLMQDWRLSPFELEGPIRHQMRATLCLFGHSWDRSNAEAASIVDKAIRELGLVRPSAEEGQPDHSGMFEYCSWCACAIDEEGRTKGQRFCCVECAKAAVIHREGETAEYEGKVLRSAARMIARDRAPLRSCRHCANMFRSDATDAIYCSHKCYGESRRTAPDAQCQHCNTTFRPTSGGAEQRYCSIRCRGAVVAKDRKARTALLTFQCAECQKSYSPPSERSRHCSKRCSARALARLKQQNGGKAISYAYTCKCCGVGFTSSQSKNPFCSQSCRNFVRRFESGQGRKLTPMVFDYLMHLDRVPMTGLHITDRLFETA